MVEQYSIRKHKKGMFHSNSTEYSTWNRPTMESAWRFPTFLPT